MTTSYNVNTLEQQENDGTISPEGLAWLMGYQEQRTSDVHADAYMPGGADANDMEPVPDKFAGYASHWQAGAQESHDAFIQHGEYLDSND